MKINVESIAEQIEGKDERWIDRYCQSMINGTYTPYVEKISMIESIIKVACRDDEGNLRVDSNSIHLLFVCLLLNQYTTVEVDFKENVCNTYDKLSELGILNLLLDKIPANEKTEMEEILDRTLEDVMTNEYEPHHFVSKQIGRIINVIDNLLDTASEKENTDINKDSVKKVKKFLSNIGIK